MKKRRILDNICKLKDFIIQKFHCNDYKAYMEDEVYKDNLQDVNREIQFFTAHRTPDEMIPIANVYEDVYWLFSDRCSHSSLIIKRIDFIAQNKCRVTLENDVYFNISYQSGDDLLRSIREKLLEIMKDENYNL